MTEKFITIKGKRIRSDTIRRYDPRPPNDDRCKKSGVTVYLDNDEVIVDWDQTVEDIDKQLEEE